DQIELASSSGWCEHAMHGRREHQVVKADPGTSTGQGKLRRFRDVRARKREGGGRQQHRDGGGSDHGRTFLFHAAEGIVELPSIVMLPTTSPGIMVSVAKRSSTNRDAASNGGRWVLFMPTIPPKPASIRVKIWRRLQTIGAVGLRGAVYALPNREECIE